MPTSSRSFNGETFPSSFISNLNNNKIKSHFEAPLETDHIQIYLKNNESKPISDVKNKYDEIKLKSPKNIRNPCISSIKESAMNQSSSVDSVKEDNLIANFGHSGTTSISIVSSNQDLVESKESSNQISERPYLDKDMRVVSYLNHTLNCKFPVPLPRYL